jgi:hypothetical protein
MINPNVSTVVRGAKCFEVHYTSYNMRYLHAGARCGTCTSQSSVLMERLKDREYPFFSLERLFICLLQAHVLLAALWDPALPRHPQTDCPTIWNTVPRQNRLQRIGNNAQPRSDVETELSEA